MENLKELLEANKYVQLKEELVKQNEVDIADFLEELDDEKMLLVFRILPKDICADVFAYMDAEQRQHIILSISDNEVRQIIDDLFLDDAVDFLEELPAGVVKKVLKNVDEDTRRLINTFLQYTPDSAGSIMTVEYVEFKQIFTVKQAIDRIRETGLDKETIYTCYCVDDARKLTGTVALRKLILSDENTSIEEIMETNFIQVRTQDDQEYVADVIKKYDLLSVPVTDNEDRLVGIVTVDDAIDVLEEEYTEDIEIMAAMLPSETPYLKSSIWELSKNRIPWLLILMISATLTGSIITHYEDILATVLILTSFIPMLTDTGGNAGSQSSTLIIRGLATGDIETKDILKIVWKEFRVSLVCGLALGTVNFMRLVFISRVGATIAFVVSSSMVIIIILAKILGGILPIGAKKLKLDPAIMASPLITTIVDALGLIVYFRIAAAFLNL